MKKKLSLYVSWSMMIIAEFISDSKETTHKTLTWQVNLRSGLMASHSTSTNRGGQTSQTIGMVLKTALTWALEIPYHGTTFLVIAWRKNLSARMSLQRMSMLLMPRKHQQHRIPYYQTEIQKRKKWLTTRFLLIRKSAVQKIMEIVEFFALLLILMQV